MFDPGLVHPREHLNDAETCVIPPRAKQTNSSLEIDLFNTTRRDGLARLTVLQTKERRKSAAVCSIISLHVATRDSDVFGKKHERALAMREHSVGALCTQPVRIPTAVTLSRKMICLAHPGRGSSSLIVWTH